MQLYESLKIERWLRYGDRSNANQGQMANLARRHTSRSGYERASKLSMKGRKRGKTIIAAVLSLGLLVCPSDYGPGIIDERKMNISVSSRE